MNANLSIEVRCDLGVTIEAMKCIAGAIAAKNPRELQVEIRALEALCEIQSMASRARADLGLDGPGQVQHVQFDWSLVQLRLELELERMHSAMLRFQLAAMQAERAMESAAAAASTPPQFIDPEYHQKRTIH